MITYVPKLFQYLNVCMFVCGMYICVIDVLLLVPLFIYPEISRMNCCVLFIVIFIFILKYIFDISNMFCLFYSNEYFDLWLGLNYLRL